jgi:hypothetical protein
MTLTIALGILVYFGIVGFLIFQPQEVLAQENIIHFEISQDNNNCFGFCSNFLSASASITTDFPPTTDATIDLFSDQRNINCLEGSENLACSNDSSSEAHISFFDDALIEQDNLQSNSNCQSCSNSAGFLGILLGTGSGGSIAQNNVQSNNEIVDASSAINDANNFAIQVATTDSAVGQSNLQTNINTKGGSSSTNVADNQGTILDSTSTQLTQVNDQINTNTVLNLL